MEENQNTSLQVFNDDTGLIGELTTRSAQFCSFTAETYEEKALMFKAMNNPDKRLADCINQEIFLVDVFCETVGIKQDDDSTVICPRIVLIDNERISYQCVSQGVMNALKKLITVYGLPTWEKPIKIMPRGIKKNKFTILTFDVVV